MKKIVTLYIGLYDKDSHRQENLANYYYSVLDEYFPCYTLTHCMGRYQHKDGTIISEPTLKVEYVDMDSTINVQKTCDIMKQKFNQECIMVTCTEIDVTFM